MKTTILNDPIYGFVEVPQGILSELLRHPILQRLRRISQLGLTHYVYPGAMHNRFHHALGALHLMRQALQSLQKKGVDISPEEEEAACIAILLHDIGHGPFSHSLEYQLLSVSHEWLSIALMQTLNVEFKGALELALDIFQNRYKKPFLHQLVSSQLDMDRMDYLMRDSFYTGVNEGIIGYNRLLYMLDVRDGQLLISAKGLYSVEKFLIARRLMYWQVYLHKTVIVAGEMMKAALKRAKELLQKGQDIGYLSPALRFFLEQNWSKAALDKQEKEQVLQQFIALDDTDILFALKTWTRAEDRILRFLAQSLLNRQLYKIELQDEAFSEEEKKNCIEKLRASYALSEEELPYLFLQGEETNKAYKMGKSELKILLKSGEVQPISQWKEHHVPHKELHKYFIAYPKNFIPLPYISRV